MSLVEMMKNMALQNSQLQNILLQTLLSNMVTNGIPLGGARAADDEDANAKTKRSNRESNNLQKLKDASTKKDVLARKPSVLDEEGEDGDSELEAERRLERLALLKPIRLAIFAVLFSSMLMSRVSIIKLPFCFFLNQSM
jgi:hypothetical protein